MVQNILIQYFQWHFFDVPGGILKAWRNFLRFNLNYWSIPLLFRTIFSHWRRYEWVYGRGFDLGRYVEVFFSNLISRLIGATIRSIFILIGLILEIFIFLGGVIILLGWIIFPTLLMAGLIFGLKILI